MKIRHTKTEDLAAVMAIYEGARDFMARTGNPHQWGDKKNPPQSRIEQDIAEGKSYVCVDENDRVIGTFYYDYGMDIDPTYAIIEEGAWTNPDAYGVIHRIASSFTQPGIGSFCINWAFSQCGHLRIDTHEDNHVMQSLLTKLGFTRCGIIYLLEDHDPRIAYEKSL